jgi:hypothetical protein
MQQNHFDNYESLRISLPVGNESSKSISILCIHCQWKKTKRIGSSYSMVPALHLDYSIDGLVHVAPIASSCRCLSRGKTPVNTLSPTSPEHSFEHREKKRVDVPHQMFGCQEDQMFGCQEDQMFGCQEDQMFGCQEDQMFGCQEDQMFGCQEDQSM